VVPNSEQIQNIFVRAFGNEIERIAVLEELLLSSSSTLEATTVLNSDSKTSYESLLLRKIDLSLFKPEFIAHDQETASLILLGNVMKISNTLPIILPYSNLVTHDHQGEK